MILNSNILERIIDLYKLTDRLDIPAKGFSDVEPDTFQDCRNRAIKSLNLKSVKKQGHNDRPTRITFKVLHQPLFEPLKEHLIELDLSYNTFEGTFNFLRGLKNLKKLVLKGCSFAVLFQKGSPEFKESNNQLTHLDLGDSDLEIKSKDIFNDLKRLKYLDLSGRSIKLNGVLPELFKELKHLETLKLIGTEYEPKIDHKSFVELKSLKELIIEESDFSRGGKFHMQSRRLEKLTCSCFPVSRETFSSLTNLREIHLHCLSTPDVDSIFFNDHPKLESVTLSLLPYSPDDRHYHNKSLDRDDFFFDLGLFDKHRLLKSLKLLDINVNFNSYSQTAKFESLEVLDLSVSNIKEFPCRYTYLDDSTFKKMKSLKVLNLKGNRIILEGDCFKSLKNLKELDLSYAIINVMEGLDIFSSLKSLEIFHCIEISKSFELYKLASLVNLRELKLKIRASDVEKFKKMIRKEMHIYHTPTNDYLCYFILNNLTKLVKLDLSDCGLTFINKEVFGKMRDLTHLDLSKNKLQQIADDSFDRLVNLECINLRSNQLKDIKINRLFLKQNNLKEVKIDFIPVVDMFEDVFNFKSLEYISLHDDSASSFAANYHKRRLMKQIEKSTASSADIMADMESIELMLERIDCKMNVLKEEKEISFEQFKASFDPFNLKSIEEKLKQTREALKQNLREKREKSIDEMNQMSNQFKQLKISSNNSSELTKAKLVNENVERLFRNQEKLSTNGSTLSLKGSLFVNLKYSNNFSTTKLVKYAKMMPHMLRELKYENKCAIPITKNKFLVIKRFIDPTSRFMRPHHWIFESRDKCGSLMNSVNFGTLDGAWAQPLQEVIDTFSIIDGHVVTVRKFYDERSEITSGRLKESCFIESKIDEECAVNLLIDVFDENLKKRSEASMKFNGEYGAGVYTCGNGILVHLDDNDDDNDSRKQLSTHLFAFYSLDMKLKRERTKIVMECHNTYKDLVEPIKFDDNKCFIYCSMHKKAKLLRIYSFSDATLLQEFDLCFQTDSFNTMVVDSSYNLIFSNFYTKTINCYNLVTNELSYSYFPEKKFFKRSILTGDERLFLFGDDSFNEEEFIYSLEDIVSLDI